MKYFFLFSVVFFWSCKETSEKQETTQKVNEVVVSIKNPSAENSSLPRLFSNGEELFLSWVSKKDSLSILNYSKYSNGVWSPSEEIISGADWFVNWADFPQIAENNGNILTSYLQKSADGTYAYDVKLNLYNDSTKTWKRNFILHNDGTKSEHGFVSIQPYSNNAFFVSWLDGRNTIGGHEDHNEHGSGAMTLRGALVTLNGEIVNEVELDNRVCDCCNTAAAVNWTNNIFVAYRDRTEDEIRDISLKIISGRSGHDLTGTKVIGNDQWKIAGCPVNGPAIDTYKNATAVAWFTGVGDEGKVNVAFSGNYKNPIRVDAGNATGRVDLVMLSETEAAVLWMEPQGEDEVIQLIKVSSLGAKGVPITISKTSRERASGFPQLERVGDTLFVAWTVTAKESSKIEMASVSLNVL